MEQEDVQNVVIEEDEDQDDVSEDEEDELSDGESDDGDDDEDENDVQEVDNKWGLKRVCPLNVLKAFHCVTGFPPDLMHDLLARMNNTRFNTNTFYNANTFQYNDRANSPPPPHFW